jgi:hypothetical protein
MPNGKANDLGTLKLARSRAAQARTGNLRFDACGQSPDKMRLQMRFTRAR